MKNGWGGDPIRRGDDDGNKEENDRQTSSQKPRLKLGNANLINGCYPDRHIKLRDGTQHALTGHQSYQGSTR